MAILTREEILNADDLTRKLVAVPEWGGEVYVRTMTGRERETMAASAQGSEMENVQARLVASACVDEAGERVFTLADVEDLGAKSCAALARVFTAVMELNAITDEDVEEMAGN